jgi:hypothetical protein
MPVADIEMYMEILPVASSSLENTSASSRQLAFNCSHAANAADLPGTLQLHCQPTWQACSFLLLAQG